MGKVDTGSQGIHNENPSFLSFFYFLFLLHIGRKKGLQGRIQNMFIPTET